jgi:hypothetical protein
MKIFILIPFFTLSLLVAQSTTNDINTSKKKIFQKEDNTKTIDAIEDFMKKYSGVTKGC